MRERKLPRQNGAARTRRENHDGVARYEHQCCRGRSRCEQTRERHRDGAFAGGHSHVGSLFSRAVTALALCILPSARDAKLDDGGSRLQPVFVSFCKGDVDVKLVKQLQTNIKTAVRLLVQSTGADSP